MTDFRNNSKDSRGLNFYISFFSSAFECPENMTVLCEGEYTKEELLEHFNAWKDGKASYIYYLRYDGDIYTVGGPVLYCGIYQDREEETKFDYKYDNPMPSYLQDNIQIIKDMESGSDF